MLVFRSKAHLLLTACINFACNTKLCLVFSYVCWKQVVICFCLFVNFIGFNHINYLLSVHCMVIAVLLALSFEVTMILLQ